MRSQSASLPVKIVASRQCLVFSKENTGIKEGKYFTPTLILPPQLGGGRGKLPKRCVFCGIILI